MAKIELILPAMGEGIIDATITKWLVAEGDSVSEDDPICEVATDKVDTEIPAPKDCIIEKFMFAEGDTPSVGSIIAILRDSNTDEAIVDNQKTEVVNTQEIEKPVVSESVKSSFIENRTPSGKFLSPLVRSMASKNDILVSELELVNGTGVNGRITKDDLLIYIDSKNSVVANIKPEIIEDKPSVPPVNTISSSSNVEIIEMDRMRKLIADHMVESKRIAPHVTSFVEIDVTALVNWRNKVKDMILQSEGQKITFMSPILECTTKAIKDFPLINSSVDGDKIIRKKDINIGMATALPSGNLIVPVIKNCDRQSLLGLTANVNELADKARNNKLKPDDIQGGTFTITNVGSFGNITGTPIINQPQVAILAIGAIIKKPTVIETPEGDTIGIRSKMVLALSYDHRVVDGALGGMFLKRVGDYIEQWDSNRNI
ncbi:MAG: 2-oxo acid dehydrogenase subunit E2 [Bacteroidales bacterium]|nr:2-oxo acid dehydrogenase subunit E2 [Bacteroidales bacterium]